MENTPLTGKKILWLEDDAFLTDILARKIVAAGAELMHASDANQAFSMLEKSTPDILILDILLPGMTGFEFLAKVRETPQGKNLPVIFLSNYGQKEDVAKATELGAKKFILKASATLDEIVEAVQQALA